jgi:hypothetical protein
MKKFTIFLKMGFDYRVITTIANSPDRAIQKALRKNDGYSCIGWEFNCRLSN